MRLASLLALAAAAAHRAGARTAPPTRSSGAAIAAQTERITIIDENGRVRTKITVRPRSYLDGGTEVLPGERKFMDYAYPPTYRTGSRRPAAWDPNGIHRYPLPMPFELPGYNPYYELSYR